MRTISSCSSPLRFDSLAQVFVPQVFVGEKSNGITAIHGLLEMLNPKGAVVTIDAMGTQRPAPEISWKKAATTSSASKATMVAHTTKSATNSPLPYGGSTPEISTRHRNSAANHSILRRIALYARNRMCGPAISRNSLAKREMRAPSRLP